MKNLLFNFVKKKYFFLIIKKIFKRFEKDTSERNMKKNGKRYYN